MDTKARIRFLEQQALRDKMNEEDAKRDHDWQECVRYGERRMQKQREIRALRDSERE
jgi:hypothetical protein